MSAAAALVLPSPATLPVRPARPDEAEAVADLVGTYAEQGLMLPRSTEEVLESIGEYRVVRSPDGEVVGSAALRAFDRELVEIVAFAVSEDWQGRGVGTDLLLRVVDEALMRGYGRVFAMTLRPAIFERIGFREVERSRIPEKIRRDCVGCPFRTGCRERTLLLDVRPFSRLGTVSLPVPVLALAPSPSAASR